MVDAWLGTTTRTNGPKDIYSPPVPTSQTNDVAFTIVGVERGR